MRSDLCLTVWILRHKLWGKMPIEGRLRSEHWWQQRLDWLINKEEDPIPPENLWDGKVAKPMEIPND